MDKIRIKSPATIANLSCGFDVLGLCLDKPYDEIEVTKNLSRNIILNIEDSQFSNIPSNPKQNTGGVPAELILNDLNLDYGFTISIKKGIPLCGGLGSSAATASGVVFAINKLLDIPLSMEQMLSYALEGEKVSVSNPHADNIAPCLKGGLCLIRDTRTLDIIDVPISEYTIALIHPDIKINTEDARNILPKDISLALAITQWGNLGGLIMGFIKNDNAIIKRSMEDKIIEPVRSSLIKGFVDIKNNALKTGAIGFGISGSGPTMFALCESASIAENICSFSNKFYSSLNIKCDTYISKVNKNGPTII